MAYDFWLFPFGEEQEKERDRQVMRSFYSQRAAQIQELVEQECDRMEYDGSMMFDVYPDRFMMEHLCRKIEKEMQKKEEVLAMDQCCHGQDGIRDLIGVLLFNEMFRRRCRRRDRRRYFF